MPEPVCALILTDATLWGDDRTGLSAVAVDSAGRILTTGPKDAVEAIAGPATEIQRLGGASLWPAFHDAHIHPLAGGTARAGCDLHEVHSAEDYERLVRKALTDLEAGQWLFGGGWFGDVFDDGRPHRKLLDRWAPGHPVALLSHDAHGVWVNTAALERAGIDELTPDPRGGLIGRDADGTPSGLLFDAAADLVSQFAPEPRPEQLDEALLVTQDHLFSLGIVGWQDAIVGEYLSMPNPLGSYLRLSRSGRLRARVTGAQWWDRTRGLDQIEDSRRLRDEHAGDRLRFDAVKIMQDGICENCTGAMLRPYERHAVAGPEQLGDSLIDPEQLNTIVTALDAAGFSVHFHGVGDRAVRECLDAVEAARAANGPNRLRHQIAHVDVVDPQDVPRFAALAVIANLQPLWARADKEIVERKLPLLGPARSAQHFPFGSLARSGAALAMGSDWPVSSPDPLWGLYTAATRTAPPADPHGVIDSAYENPMNSEQRLDLDTAVDAYTRGSAAANGYAEHTGALRAGLDADLVVLDRTVRDATDLGGAAVDRTLLAGQTVYERRNTGR
ncbi:amidohydrolase [Kocuria rhizophila]|uniref:amidohydrolase n=1 Tax=Kocuria rhizophila TaxID=72000 RepID=UPI00073D9AA4|nr:amidohydrolase [Kocuria rhizophila]